MSYGEDMEEEALADRQAAGLYPIGRALRSTYHADNHDSLGQDLTGLMLQLARVDDDAPPAAVARAVPPPPTVQPESWLRRLFGWTRSPA